MTTACRKPVLVVAAIVLGVAAGARAASAGSSLEPAELRCEYRESPVNVDAARPRLQWLSRAVDPGRRSLRQTAYRILVASDDAALREERGDMWDSGKIAANQSIDIRYGGQALRPHTKYWWQVQLWDEDDNPTRWSEPASFWWAGSAIRLCISWGSVCRS